MIILFRVLLLYSVILNLMMLQDVEGIGHPKLNIACQDRTLAKGVGMKYKPVPRIGSVCYGLKCCTEVKF